MTPGVYRGIAAQGRELRSSLLPEAGSVVEADAGGIVPGSDFSAQTAHRLGSEVSRLRYQCELPKEFHWQMKPQQLIRFPIGKLKSKEDEEEETDPVCGKETDVSHTPGVRRRHAPFLPALKRPCVS